MPGEAKAMRNKLLGRTPPAPPPLPPADATPGAAQPHAVRQSRAPDGESTIEHIDVGTPALRAAVAVQPSPPPRSHDFADRITQRCPMVTGIVVEEPELQHRIGDDRDQNDDDDYG